MCIEEDRKHIFEEFYKLTDHDTQNKYLYGFIEHLEPKQRRARLGTGKKRSSAFRYHVRLNSGDFAQVCKSAFQQIHGISKRRIECLGGVTPRRVLVKGYVQY